MIRYLIPWLDAIADWSPDELPPVEVPSEIDGTRQGAPPLPSYPVVDREAAASRVTYRNGKVKRTRYRPVRLAERKVVIGLHQAGVERSEGRWLETVHRVTCHRAIGPEGNRYRVHPLDRRLVCTNRVDRAPWHCVGIETLGNFRGTPNGRWYKPDRFGRGTLAEAQLGALREEIVSIVSEVAELGGVVIGIIPHRTTGRNRDGKPNRQICPGFEIWSRAGEWSAAELGLRVPSPGWSLGGLPVPEAWHGPYWSRCTRFL